MTRPLSAEARGTRHNTYGTAPPMPSASSPFPARDSHRRVHAGAVGRTHRLGPIETGVARPLEGQQYVATADLRETGEFLWATPTIAQNVISHIDGATGAVTENSEVVFSALGQEVLACLPGPAGRTGKRRLSPPDQHDVLFRCATPVRGCCPPRTSGASGSER